MLLELFKCPADLLNDIPKIEAILVDVVEKVKATLVNKNFHHFSPHGVSGVVVIAESHRSEERRVGKECRSRWSPYH